MYDDARSNVGLHDPKLGDTLLIDDEKYQIVERCSCGLDADHIRWFLEGESQLAGSLTIVQSATLAKEWDEDGEAWWWFGRRIAASEVVVGEERLSRWLTTHRKDVPSSIRYDGTRYRLVGESEPPTAVPDEDTVPLTLWEYVDDDDIDSVLVEQSSDGDITLYHGAYYDPVDLRLA